LEVPSVEDAAEGNSSSDAAPIAKGGAGGASSPNKSLKPAVSASAAKSVLASRASKAQCGTLLLLLQSHVPTPLLLNDGQGVLEVLGTFLRASAHGYEEGRGTKDSQEAFAQAALARAAKDAQLAAAKAGVAGGASSGKNRGKQRPLIEEIGPENSSAQSSGSFHSKEEDKKGDSDADAGQGAPTLEIELTEAQQTLATVLALLSALISAGVDKRPAKEEDLIKSLLPSLRVIAGNELHVDISQAATELALCVLTRGMPAATSSHVAAEDVAPPGGAPISASDAVIERAFSEARELLRAQDPSERALGLRTVIQALRTLSPNSLSEKAVVNQGHKLVALLADAESFVYLNAINALGALAGQNRKALCGLLLAAFAGDGEHSSSSSNSAGAGSTKYSYRHRAIVSEALSVLVRRAGAAAPPLVPSLVSACVRNIRLLTLSVEEQRVLDGAADLNRMRLKRATSSAKSTAAAAGAGTSSSVALSPAEIPSNQTRPQGSSRSKPGSALSAAEESAAEEMQEAQMLAAAALADRVLLRQSALSLLADGVACAGWAAQAHLADVLDIAAGVLSLERGSLQGQRLSRRSAAFILRYVVSGLQDKLFTLGERSSTGVGAVGAVGAISAANTDFRGSVHAASGSGSSWSASAGFGDVEQGSYLLRIYRILKGGIEDTDDVVRFHCEAAIGLLGDLVRADMMSNMGVNEKPPQITILGGRWDQWFHRIPFLAWGGVYWIVVILLNM
jgi:hypothetical protein